MSVREVTELRKAGKLRDAYELAKQELYEAPSEWTKMSMFWVLRDFAQNRYLPAQNINQVQVCLNQMKELLPDMIDSNGAGERAYQSLFKQIQPNADIIKSASELSKSDPTTAYQNVANTFGKSGESIDILLHEDFGWIIYRYIKANIDTFDSVRIRTLLHDYILLRNERPSMLHSYILNLALSYSKNHSDFIFYRFFMMWGPNNMRYEDFQDRHIDGKDIHSIISRICAALVNSNTNFDVQEFIGSFESRRKVEVIEHLRQSYFWKLWNIQQEGNTSFLCQSFENYTRQYSLDTPSHWHSEILKIANRFIPQDNSSCFFNFVKLWYGTGRFLSGDWEKTISKDGTEYPSLVVKTAKRCFEALRSNSQLHNIENINWLKSLYKSISEKDSEDDWSIRKYAQLCKQTGNKQETIEIYKKLLLDKGDKYYLWSELAECIEDDNALKLGLLLKAIKLEKNEDFLGDLHLDLAKVWLDEGYGANAKIELDKYAQHRKSKGWNISDAYRTLLEQVSISDNSMQSDDSIYFQKAEDFVFAAFDWKDYVLIDRWTNNGVERCSFYDGESLSFSVKGKRFPILKNAQPGDIISWRCYLTNEIIHDPRYRKELNRTIAKSVVSPLVAKRSQNENWSLLPIKYGIIDYINTENHVLHIITQEHKLIFYPNNNQNFNIGDIVKFHQYEKERDENKITCAVNVDSCVKDEALHNMPSRIVVVDDVNEEKKLFHVVLGPNKISDIVKYSETTIRPQIGDFLKITYCIKHTKDGKKHIKFLDIATSEVGCSGVKETVTGRLKVKYRNEFHDGFKEPDFAFINDFYVHRNILRKLKITNDCDVVAKVILGGDNKWKVYDIEFPQADVLQPMELQD